MEMLSADMLMMTAQFETPNVANILPSLLERIVNNAGQGHPAVDDFIPNTTGYTAFEINTYDFVIDGEASPDTFKWRKNDGAYTEGVSVDDADITITDGITVKWLALTGHTIGDTWRIRMKPKAIIYIDDEGKRQMIRHDGSIVAFDTDPTFGDITADSLTVDDITAANPIQGDVEGNVTGDLTGNVTGDVTGNVTGNLTGDSAGTHTGPVTGDVTGDLFGDGILDILRLNGSEITLAAAATAINLTGKTSFLEITGDAGGNTITSFTAEAAGQFLLLQFLDSLVTITTTAVALNGNVNFVGAAGDLLLLFRNSTLGGTGWKEIGRSKVAGFTGPVVGTTITGTTIIASVGHQDTPVSRIATADGTGTGTIAASTRKVRATNQTDANDFLVLPAPVIGDEVEIIVEENCELRTSDPATIALNAVTGAGKELAMAAGETFIVKCVSLTAFVAVKIGADGTIATGGTPD